MKRPFRSVAWLLVLGSCLGIASYAGRPPENTPPAVPPGIVSSTLACGMSDPVALRYLTQPSDVIAVGRVTSILRQEYTPIGIGRSDPHTVYEFAVEQYLKAEGEGPKGTTLQVIRNGAVMSEGAYIWEGFPFLNVGDRYIVFLTDSVTEFNREYGGSFCSTGDGEGICAYLDDYSFPNPVEGTVLLWNGRTQPAVDAFQQARVAPFAEGPQLFYVTEEQAIAAIRRSLLEVGEPPPTPEALPPGSPSPPEELPEAPAPAR